jgi:hypothetical protein
MRLTGRGWLALIAVTALIAITAFGSTGVVAVAWAIAALLLVGGALGSSPAIQLRGRVTRIDSGGAAPRRDPDVKRP